MLEASGFETAPPSRPDGKAGSIVEEELMAAAPSVPEIASASLPDVLYAGLQ